MTKIRILFAGIVCCFLGWGENASAYRDPKVEELPIVREVAGQLRFYLQEALAQFSSLAGSGPEVDRALELLEVWSQEANRFHERVATSEDSPWRTTSYFVELNRAWNRAGEIFTQRETLRVNPPLLGEINYLMNVLLQYYLYPPLDRSLGFYSYDVPARYYSPAYSYPAYLPAGRVVVKTPSPVYPRRP